VGKNEHFYTVDGNVNSVTAMESNMEVPQKLKIEVPYNPEVISLLDVYPKECTLG
jgi:hypothetical protein